MYVDPRIRALAVLTLLFLTGSAAGGGFIDRLFAPRADLWERWSAHGETGAAPIDHGPWQRLLSAYVGEGEDGVSRLAYGRVGDRDRARLADYVAELGRVPISRYPRDEQLAFWINLYNASTVRLVLEHYPVRTIRDIDISPGLFADGPWGTKLVAIEGQPLSLDDIEHRILRPIWKDPRIHYGLNCASVGCPDLQRTAFTGKNSDELLDRAARRYVNHPRGVDIQEGRLTLSSLYSWFEPDFDADGGVLAHLRRYAEPGLAHRLGGFDRADSYRYDWGLNDLMASGSGPTASPATVSAE